VAKKMKRTSADERRLKQLEDQLASATAKADNSQRRLEAIDRENQSLSAANRSLVSRNMELESRVVRISLLAAQSTLGAIYQCAGDITLPILSDMQSKLKNLLD
jgi:septal ring factor EnvC (AmiA/AmiB activator)